MRDIKRIQLQINDHVFFGGDVLQQKYYFDKNSRGCAVRLSEITKDGEILCSYDKLGNKIKEVESFLTLEEYEGVLHITMVFNSPHTLQSVQLNRRRREEQAGIDMDEELESLEKLPSKSLLELEEEMEDLGNDLDRED